MNNDAISTLSDVVLEMRKKIEAMERRHKLQYSP
jgi:hypothetical protein